MDGNQKAPEANRSLADLTTTGGEPKLSTMQSVPELPLLCNPPPPGQAAPFTLDQFDHIPGTIVWDAIVEYLVSQGFRRAWALHCGMVFGTIVRYERMKSECCHASTATIAHNARCSVRDLFRYRKTLIEHDLIIDLTPGRRNRAHRHQITDFSVAILGFDPRARSSDSFASSLPLTEGLHARSSDSFAIAKESDEREEEATPYVTTIACTVSKHSTKHVTSPRPSEQLNVTVLSCPRTRYAVISFSTSTGPTASVPSPPPPPVDHGPPSVAVRSTPLIATRIFCG